MKKKVKPEECNHQKGNRTAVEFYEEDDEKLFGRCTLCPARITENHPLFQLHLDAMLRGGKMAAKGSKK